MRMPFHSLHGIMSIPVLFLNTYIVFTIMLEFVGAGQYYAT